MEGHAGRERLQDHQASQGTRPMKRTSTLAVLLIAILATSAAAAIDVQAAAGRHAASRRPAARRRHTDRAAVRPAVEEGPGVLMGAPQKEHWEIGSAECKTGVEECSDEISQGQFVAWP